MWSKKWLALAALIVVASMLISACEPEIVTVETIIEKEVTVEVEVEKVVTATPEATEEAAAAGGEVDVYRIGIYEDPKTLNYWNYLGPGSSVWTAYVIDGYAASLFGLSDQRFDFIPSLAKELVQPVKEGDDTWVYTVPMVENATWSDGEAIDAYDVVFTHNACKDLKLTQNWPSNCRPNGVEGIEAEVIDDYTVQYTFPVEPSLATWNAGIALATILPEHFWKEQVEAAYAFVDGVEPPDAERPEDCEAEDLDDDGKAACEVWGVYDEAFENARKTLYEADPTGSPAYGGFTTDKFEPGAFVQRTSNDNYFFKGATISEYDDGTWMVEFPAGETMQLFGDASGEKTLEYVSGPHAPNVLLSIYGSQDAAFLAMQNGEVDYVITPTGVSRGLREKAQTSGDIKTYTNADYGMYYVAFNMRKAPMDDFAFRQAIDIIVDKEFVVNKVLQGTVFPMYSTMPPGNGYWHNPDVPTPYKDLTREERVAEAVKVLKEAGWNWTQEPEWSEDQQDVIPGEGLTMPNGAPMPEITILGPGPAYDPLRATFNQWISEWAREMGMPIKSELTGFNNMLDPVFVSADFDMYILGWSLGNVAFPDYYESFWHSRNDTATTGNFNTPGFQNDEYDALIDEFMSTTDLDVAREKIFAAQVMLAEQRPYINLFYKQVYDLARNNVQFPYTDVLGGIAKANAMQTDTMPLAQ
ncbi:MAG: ABC transporter substrate-binding protein [Anaerolineae bacterium]|nr:ABC transporter substrate-binding protein [Anaerolineae bacterium]